MRRSSSMLLLLSLLVTTGGCRDQDMRETGRRIEQAIAERWEAWREDVDRDTKARAQQRSEVRAQAQAQVAARTQVQAQGETEQALRASLEVPKAYRLDAAAVNEILAIAQRRRARSLTVKLRGKTVLQRRWGAQPELQGMMQMTYPIVALTMGQLVAEGKLASLDTPLSRWLPAFRTDKKRRITVRDVMTGRDGLDSPEPFPAGLYRQPDYIGFYAGTDVPYTPGQGQVLPRESVVLLGEVVKATAGMPLDRWVATRLLEPLGIRRSRWRKDSAGHLDVWAGLWLPPEGALRIAELVLQEGRWNGRQVLPRAWVLEATSPAAVSDAPELFTETHGYGWRVGTRWLPYDTVPIRRQVADRRFGFQASDYIGNHLIVNPTKQLVALHTVPWDGSPVTRSIATFEFDDLADRLDAAVQ